MATVPWTFPCPEILRVVGIKCLVCPVFIAFHHCSYLFLFSPLSPKPKPSTNLLLLFLHLDRHKFIDLVWFCLSCHVLLLLIEFLYFTFPIIRRLGIYMDYFYIHRRCFFFKIVCSIIHRSSRWNGICHLHPHKNPHYTVVRLSTRMEFFLVFILHLSDSWPTHLWHPHYVDFHYWCLLFFGLFKCIRLCVLYIYVIGNHI